MRIICHTSELGNLSYRSQNSLYKELGNVPLDDVSTPINLKHFPNRYPNLIPERITAYKGYYAHLGIACPYPYFLEGHPPGVGGGRGEEKGQGARFTHDSFLSRKAEHRSGYG